eukprot:XP_001692424.1 predicted protein [Chlamydomonas reinhardtii]
MAPPLAAQRLGMRVGRWWAFNRGLPLNPGEYDEDQYRGPEHYLYMATGSAEGKTVLDYYRDRSTRELVGIKLDWLREMSAYLRSIDSHHLITQGSEGYFMPDPETNAHLLNPGAGAQCEGEDWVATVSMKNHDFACVHVYERQLEALPFNPDPRRNDPTWKKCDFVCYINWFTRYMEAHVEVARRIGKPLLLEEYGLTWWREWEYDRRVLLQVSFEQLIDSARAGGPLAGALFWNAAANSTGDYDGNDCAVRNSVVWRPPPLPSHVNYTAYRDYVEGLDAVDIIAWATAQLPN